MAKRALGGREPTMSVPSRTRTNTIWNRRGKPPVVRIEAGRNARINFSVEAVKLLGLKEGMRIAFRIHGNDKGVIYFYEQATGLALKKQMQGKTGSRLAVYCRPLAKKLLQHFGYKVDTNKTFLISNETIRVDNCSMWFINKENVHKPLQWKIK